MRIRKRFLSLSAAITAPPPPSDPHAGDHQQPLLLVQQQVHPNGNLRALYDNDPQSHPSDPPLNRRPSSDHTTQIGFQTATRVSSGAGSDAKQLIVSPHKELESEEKEAIKTDDSGRKCGEASRHVNTGSLSSPPTTAHNLVLKGWLEGDRLIPIKKRRGSFGKGACNNKNHDLEDDNNEMMMIEGTLMKPKSNLKKNGNKIRGNVIMEGSRCSRVNGRGWRCCQQTLVGYSLCEHHLGKGRLRSMNSVRNRAQKVALKQEEEDKGDEIVSMGEPHDFEDDDKDWVDESVSCMNKCSNYNKKKIGVVKARSLSSLLSQIGS